MFPDTIVQTNNGNIIESTLKDKFITAPVYSIIKDKKRMGRRVCTFRFKIYPVQKKIRKLENCVGKRLKSESYTVGLGFSTDEFWRAKPSRTKWIKNVFPLLELQMSRNDCKSILKRRNIKPCLLYTSPSPRD